MSIPSFNRAIVRKPTRNLALGLTTANLGLPDVQTAMLQHRNYCRALSECGLDLVFLEPDPEFPDSTFVEDTAILTERTAVIARPGAASRLEETKSVASALNSFYGTLDFINPPGKLDGGDVCKLEDHFIIGISERTNENGANQLGEHLQFAGYSYRFLDIRRTADLLHLKSGMSYLGDNRVLVTKALAGADTLDEFELIYVEDGEEYAANCIRVNYFLLTPAGFPRTHQRLENLGYKLIKLEMSEFQKMDGGLSCLSLRF